MGFFTRRKKPSTSAPYLSQAPAITYHPPLSTSPPPSYEYSVPYGRPPITSYTPQQLPQSQQIARHGDETFMSVDDFNAIQQAIGQDDAAEQFSNIIANIDEDRWNENDGDFSLTIPEEPTETPHTFSETTRAVVSSRNTRERRRPTQPRTQKITIWSKVSFYTNSKLPPDLPPLRVYIPTWPLICLAAQHSANAYKSPTSSQEKDAVVSGDPALGTKAMVMKSVPCDDKKTIVFAIRGTSALSLKNWNVNLQTAPVSPAGFLEDEGNLCHSGFLRVAKALVKPIAMRLRMLLEENPNRASCNLLITGHSAGGAVAALLFSHMTSSIKSDLSRLTECFKRVHCVTFGAPPVTLLPLSKPASKHCAKSFFFAFMNEGDPVVRAEKAYVRSLVDLLSSPLPAISSQPPRKRIAAKKSFSRLQNSISRLDVTLSNLDLTNAYSQNIATLNPLKNKHSRLNYSQPNISFAPTPQPIAASSTRSRIWAVPQATLSNAGRLVVLRVPPQTSQSTRKTSNLQRTTSIRWEKDNLSKVTAHTVTDEQLRQVMFGDPTMHAMEVYLRRVDMLALKAVTCRN